MSKTSSSDTVDAAKQEDRNLSVCWCLEVGMRGSG